MARLKKGKSLSKLLARLEEPEREALTMILKKISEGDQINREDVGLLGYPFRAMPHNFTSEFFHIARKSLYDWEKLGCPRNGDGTYDLFRLHQWRLDQEEQKHKKKESLKDQKTKEEIKKLRIGNRKQEEIMMPVAEHTERMRSWATSFKAFYKTAIRRNAHLFEGLERREEAEILLEEFGKKLMEVWGASA